MFRGPRRARLPVMPHTPIEETYMQPSRNIAARVGRWSAQHRKKAIVGWIAFVVLAFAIGGKIGTDKLTKAQSGVGESGSADRIVDGAYPKSVDEMVLIQSEQAEDRRSRVPRRGRRRQPTAGQDRRRRRDLQSLRQRPPGGGSAEERCRPAELPDPRRQRKRERDGEGEGQGDGGRDGRCRRRCPERRIPTFASSSLEKAAPTTSSMRSSTPTSRRPARRRFRSRC